MLRFLHDLPKELILNLDQTPLSYISPGKYTFNPKDLKTVPIKGIDDKRQITVTFTVSVAGMFLLIQLIYEGKTLRCLPRFDFPADFNPYLPTGWIFTLLWNTVFAEKISWLSPIFA